MPKLREHPRLTEAQVRVMRTSQLVVHLATWAVHPQAAGFESLEAKQYNARLIAAELDRRLPTEESPDVLQREDSR